MDGLSVKGIGNQGWNSNGDISKISSSSDSKSMIVGTDGLSSGKAGANKSFSETLNEAIQQVNQLQVASDKATLNLATGRTDNVADVMIAAEKAEIALKTMVQVRNKIVDAYQEIMKMQV